jgi:nicotinic acid mononucleotide adenylyltransferase
MTTTLSEEDPFSLERLGQRCEEFITKEGGATSSCRLLIAVAGGGSHCISTLAATPGASRILLEGVTTYDRESYHSFVGHKNWLKNGSKETIGSGSNNGFKYASAQASWYLGQAARTRALKLTASNGRKDYRAVPHMARSVGLACSSALGSNSSQAFITVSLPHGRTMQLAACLGGKRTRLQEDVVVSHCMLTALEYSLAAWKDDDAENNYNPETVLPSLWTERLQDKMLSRKVEIVDETTTSSSLFYNKDDLATTRFLTWTEQTAAGDEIHVQLPLPPTNTNPLYEAADCILSGREQTVLLLPVQRNGSFQLVTQPVFPPHSLIFPGSFNPPHNGHVQLPQAALKGLQQDGTIHPNQIVWFELSLKNADKAPLEADTVVERLQHFLTLAEDMASHQWGIVLTNAPLFAQKVNLLHPLASPEEKDLAFCIGTDTLVRLVNPKYYNNSEKEMIQVLSNLPCRFYVGGRLEQNSTSFLTGKEEIDALPPQLQSKFTLLPDFRVDVSSTEIRKQLQDKASL